MKSLVEIALALSACSLLLTAPAFAQLKGNPENICRNGYFPRESKDYRLAKIKGAAGDKSISTTTARSVVPPTQAAG
jgi:hypothetical protein